MNAKSYWDLTERERAALTREDVEKYLAFELMEKGCGLRVTAPDLEPEAVLAVKPRDYHAISGAGYYDASVLFETREQAEQFLALRPFTKQSDHLDGTWTHWAKPIDSEIKIISAISPHEFQTHRSAIQQAAKAKAENDKRQAEYDKAVKAQDDALKGLWDDWYDCGRKANQHEKVKRTWEQYVTMAGSEPLAAKFLLKAFTREQVTEAAEWFGIAIPLPSDASEPTPSEPQSAPEAGAAF